MNRFSMIFIVLAATGGCMAVNDPSDIYEPPPRRAMTSPYYGGPSGQNSWRDTNGKATQTAANDWGNSYGSASGYSAPRATTSKTSTSPTATASAKSATKAKPKATKTEDKEVVQTAYNDKKSSDSDDGLPSATAGPKKDVSAKTTIETTKKVEAKAAPVNLGVLRLLNSKRITFHYEVKDPAAAGVGDLELWGTTDSKSWKKYDIATRTPKSIVINVKDEGLYGFSMIARGKGELTKNQPPQPGEPPQVWVAVDLTKPDVQLLGAEMNVMSQTPALVVRWSAKDTHLGPRPISLLYAEKLEGPWSAISANIENSGRYEWSMPPCVPPTLYVRVQATDMMGNVGMAQTATLHIPGRPTASTTVRSEPTLAEPPALKSVPAPVMEPQLRPVAATVPNPAVSILSVDPE